MKPPVLNRKCISVFALFYSAFFLTALQSSPSGEIIRLQTRPGVTQEILLLSHPHATANAVLFPGGRGVLKFNDHWLEKKGTNFLIRIRENLRQKKINVILFNAPSDRKDGPGMKGGFRSSSEHEADLRAVVEYISKKNRLPVWLIGTSRGTESAAFGAMQLQNKISGLVLSAPITVSSEKGTAIHEFPLENLSIPVFVLFHKKDGCQASRPEAAEKIMKKLTRASPAELRYAEGGTKTENNPCRGLSHHGFYGLENEMSEWISEFIQKNHS